MHVFYTTNLLKISVKNFICKIYTYKIICSFERSLKNTYLLYFYMVMIIFIHLFSITNISLTNIRREIKSGGYLN